MCLDEPNLRFDHPDMMIVRSTVELGRNLGLTVVAEGVETQAALNALTLMGCDQVQGFFVSPPLPVDLATDWLIAHGRRPASLLPVQRPLGPVESPGRLPVVRPSG